MSQVYPRASKLALDRSSGGYSSHVADATSLLRITVVRYGGFCSALRPLWWTHVLPRARGTDVLVIDLHAAHFDDLSVVPDVIRSCRSELTGTELRIMFDAPLAKPADLAGVIWEEIDLNTETRLLDAQDDQPLRLRITR